MPYYLIVVAILLIVFAITRENRRKAVAVVSHRKNYKNEEKTKMKELAQKFVGKDCLVYTITSDNAAVNGVIKEVTDDALLIEYEGNLQAVNLEYVTRIREYPKNAKGKRKFIFS